ncbi:hypothetical protein SPRG_12675 [Saprolegnia parasitica CBS 223.65]|uniref:Uncharacterized protein n=1 Tax=Saprolegnia parasitica (strain CBS 223.65) TaxID=695850 RepID=A0A067BUM3_SAPPC|nr:hypothetical protein SPRG_12675 [Saprolegnia parasitica CBS 223.65]KDO22179.1 hypothetical protein SPRG_12675 [Saprolegnia parasitica CBS 223.65]|eukprot:XP_012207117.1 hypothetical protein SPRG_12675 [Saprolegnia parasitica CBS 223.65]
MAPVDDDSDDDAVWAFAPPPASVLRDAYTITDVDMTPFYDIDPSFERKLHALGPRSHHANSLQVACRDDVPSLDWSQTYVTQVHMEALAAYVALTSRHLVSLNLSKNALGPRGAELLGHALITNNTIEYLDVSETELTGSPLRPSFAGLAKLVKGWESKRSMLRHLNAGLQPNGVRLVCSALAFHRSLTSLNVSNNMAGLFKDKQGYIALASLLRFSGSLTSLDMSNNPFQSGATSALEEALDGNTALTSLDATGCNVAGVFERVHLPALWDLRL